VLSGDRVGDVEHLEDLEQPLSRLLRLRAVEALLVTAPAQDRVAEGVPGRRHAPEHAEVPDLAVVIHHVEDVAPRELAEGVGALTGVRVREEARDGLA
jgi:hypothetical protein